MTNNLKLIIKSIIYRFFASISTILIVYLITGNIELAGTIGLLELISKLIIYYIFDWVWLKFMK